MPFIGPRQIGSCPYCHSPYCGGGTGAPGHDCPSRPDRRDVWKPEPIKIKIPDPFELPRARRPWPWED